MDVYPKVRTPKGYMHYAAGFCDSCKRRQVKRSRKKKFKFSREQCPVCENSVVQFVKIGWDKYCNYMEDGALLVLDA